MGGMTVGVDLRESEGVIVVERWEGVSRLEFGCDISVLGGLGPIEKGVATPVPDLELVLELLGRA